MRIFLKFAFLISSYCIYCTHYLFVESKTVEDNYYWNSSDTRRYPWLKVCSETMQYEVQPGYECSKGVHFPEGFQPECICPHGLWAVKNNICHMQTHFLLGDARHNICFRVSFKVESILFLGDPNNIWGTKAYVAPLELSTFYEIPLDGSLSPLLDLNKPLIIHMFPVNNKSIETEDGYCFPLIQSNPAHIPIHIWSSALGPTRYRVVDNCSDPLNFAFDDLLAPNIVFVRSNLLTITDRVPKPRQCPPEMIARCNGFTTTERPPQNNTPMYHEEFYPDAATEKPKEKVAKAKHPYPTIEVIEPREGNFSQFFTQRAKNVELPIMISTKMYKDLLAHSSHEAEGFQWRAGSSEETALETENAAGKDNNEYKNDKLLREIMADVFQKDFFIRQNILQQLSAQRNKGFTGQFGNHVKENKKDESYDPRYGPIKPMETWLTPSEEDIDDYYYTNYYTQSIPDDHSSESESSSGEAHSKPENHNKKRSINFSQMPNDNMDTWLSRLNNEKTINIPKNKESLERSVEEDLSGLCNGELIPPVKCLKSHSKSLPGTSYLPSSEAPRLLMNLRKTDGVKFLKDLVRNFDKHVVADDDLMHIASFTEKTVDLFLKYCSIPEAIITAASFKIAMGTMLASVNLKELKSFSINFLKPLGFSSNKEGNMLENCSKEAGVIEFLFQDKCPLKVSCTRYTISPEVAAKVITITKPELSSKRTILSSTLNVIFHFVGIMCQNDNWHDIEGFHKMKNVFSKLRHLISKYQRSSSTPTFSEPKFSEMDVQSFLRISNVPAYLMLLDKCVSAAETISENRGIPSSSLLHYSAAPASLGERGKRETGVKRSIEESSTTTTNPNDDSTNITKEDAIRQVEEGIGPVEDAINPVEQGINQVEEDIIPLEEGIKPIEEGINPVVDGTNRVEEGINHVEEGINRVEKGIEPGESLKPVEEGINPVETGINPVETGINPVAEGTNLFEEGINPVDTGIDPVDDVIDPLQESINAGEEGPHRSETGIDSDEDIDPIQESINAIKFSAKHAETGIDPVDDIIDPLQENYRAVEEDRINPVEEVTNPVEEVTNPADEVTKHDKKGDIHLHAKDGSIHLHANKDGTIHVHVKEGTHPTEERSNQPEEVTNPTEEASTATTGTTAKPQATTAQPPRNNLPKRIFNGSAICLEFYEDGFDTRKKEHSCLPKPPQP